MKSLVVSLLVFASLGVTQEVQQQATSGSSSPDKVEQVVSFNATLSEAYRHDQPVELRIELKNGSAKELFLVSSGTTHPGFLNIVDIEVLQEGKEVPRTRYGTLMDGYMARPFPDLEQLVVASGGTLKVVMPLSRLFDMSRYGEYVVRVRLLAPSNRDSDFDQSWSSLQTSVVWQLPLEPASVPHAADAPSE